MPQASGKVNTGPHGRKPSGFLMVCETSSASYSRAGSKLILPLGLFLMLGVLLIVSYETDWKNLVLGYAGQTEQVWPMGTQQKIHQSL